MTGASFIGDEQLLSVTLKFDHYVTRWALTRSLIITTLGKLALMLSQRLARDAIDFFCRMPVM